MNRPPFIMSFAAIFVLLCLSCEPSAWGQIYSHIRIVRLSFVEGDVQYLRQGGNWELAKLNLPIQQGFRLQTGIGYAEVEFEKGLALRLANNSLLEFVELSLLDGRRATKVNLSTGTVAVTAHLSRNDDFSLAAPNLQLAVPQSAQFRIDAFPTENWVKVFRGEINVESGVKQLSLARGRTLHASTGELNSSQIVPNMARDSFDKWVSQRDRALSDAHSENVFQTGASPMEN